MLDLLEGEGGFVGWEEAVDASKFEKKHQVMLSRVARKMSLKLLSCGRPQLNKFDGKRFGGCWTCWKEKEGLSDGRRRWMRRNLRRNTR